MESKKTNEKKILEFPQKPNAKEQPQDDQAMVTIVLRPQTGREDEVRTFRINRVPYHVKVGQAVEVPKFLADHIMDLSERKKLSAQTMQGFAGNGMRLGDLK